MSSKTITGRLGLLFLAFVALIVVSVGATFWGLAAQRADALVINLAGRQRMLIQQMARQAAALAQGDQSTNRQELVDSMETFTLTLAALEEGGSVPYIRGEKVSLPGAVDPQLTAELGRLRELWAPFRLELEEILTGPPESAEASAARVQNQVAALVAQADLVVREFENAAAAKVEVLRWGQALFLASAILLLVAGWVIVRRSIILPLQELRRSTERIAHGNLEDAVAVGGSGEIQNLSASFEYMRGRLLASKQELRDWAQTLEEKVRQRTGELEALYSVSSEITARLDIHQVLNTITENTRRLLGGDLAFLCLQDETGKTLRLHAANGPERAVARSISPVDAPFTGQVLQGREAITCEAAGCNGYCLIVAEPYRTSHLAAPLYAGNRVIGALCVGSSREQAFSKEASEMLTKLANVAAIALENARLYDQAERAAVLEERQRIAADMHDGLAQTLSYLHLMVDTAQTQLEAGQFESAIASLEKSESAIGQASQDIRRAIASLQEDFPLNYTLQDQIRELAAEFAGEEVQVNCRVQESKPLLLPPRQSEQVLRVAREALLNAVRHSQARQVDLTFEKADQQACLAVSDNGVGFDVDQSSSPREQRHHFGLNIMRARAAQLNGNLDVHSRPGDGTRVVLTWPLVGVEQGEDKSKDRSYGPN